MRSWIIIGAVGAIVISVLGFGFLMMEGRMPQGASPTPPPPAGWTADGSAAGGVQATETGFHGGVLNPPQPAPDFALVDQHGRTFRLRDHSGKVVVLFFGYTTCPDVCPGTLAHYRRVKEMLGEDAERVEFVFVTVDPERDTTERLGEYVSIFDPEFYGLTGDRAVLERVWADYGVYAERVDDPDSPVGYWMNHTSLSYVVDPRGDLRLAHLFGTPVEHVVEDLRKLL